MKKIVLLLVTAIISFSVKAETPANAEKTAVQQEQAVKERHYIEIKGVQNSLKSKRTEVSVNLGQLLSARSGVNNARIAKAATFSTMVDALNYFTHHGWQLAQTYAVASGPQNIIHHWIMYKDVEDDSQIFEGIVDDE